MRINHYVTPTRLSRLTPTTTQVVFVPLRASQGQESVLSRPSDENSSLAAPPHVEG